MAEIRLNVEMTEDWSLEDELKEWMVSIVNVTEKATESVCADMRSALAKHIQEDVYSAYTPKEYERRGESSGLIAQARNAPTYHSQGHAAIDFSPSGAHSNPHWHTADAQDLISRIERKDPSYFYRAQRVVPARPFWQRFVNEMVDEGVLEDSFVAAMLMQGEEITADGDLVREAADGDY